MKFLKSLFIASFCIVMACLAGCSTPVDQLGIGPHQLKIGQKYSLRREAILLRNRGQLNSIENPNRKIESYAKFSGYESYYSTPIDVLPVGTIIQIKKIRLADHDQFFVMGEIMTGKHAAEPWGVLVTAKAILGMWPKDGRVSVNWLCGGRVFAPQELARNLSENVD
jgi:hypothetical protein